MVNKHIEAFKRQYNLTYVLHRTVHPLNKLPKILDERLGGAANAYEQMRRELRDLENGVVQFLLGQTTKLIPTRLSIQNEQQIRQQVLAHVELSEKIMTVGALVEDLKRKQATFIVLVCVFAEIMGGATDDEVRLCWNLFMYYFQAYDTSPYSLERCSNEILNPDTFLEKVHALAKQHIQDSAQFALQNMGSAPFSEFLYTNEQQKQQRDELEQSDAARAAALASLDENWIAWKQIWLRMRPYNWSQSQKVTEWNTLVNSRLGFWPEYQENAELLRKLVRHIAIKLVDRRITEWVMDDNFRIELI